MKKFKKILIIILVTFLLIFIINYLRIGITYLFNKNHLCKTIDIQGNTSNYVPQGLAYSDKFNISLQTSYNSKHDISKLYVTDLESGKLLKELNLQLVDGNSNNKHVGGITTDNITVWITNDYEVNEYSLDEIINTKESFIKATKTTKLINRGDFCCYKNNILWIGDFCLNPFYPVKDNNPLLIGYTAKAEIDYSIPNLIISIPKMIQGMEITDDNKFVFSSSFTYLINSELKIYEDPLNCSPTTYTVGEIQVPYYKLDKTKLEKKVKLPPMAEEVFIKDSSVYILFENSANTYKFALPKIKQVLKYDL